MTNPSIQRILWIDWMKSIGIYLIVLGHVWTWGAEFVYTFNVPLFFFLSGFLSKKYESRRIAIRKVFYNLFVPMILIIITNYFIRIVTLQDHFNLSMLVRLIEGIRIGEWKVCGVMWFVYSLILLKLCYIAFPNKKGLVVGASFLLLSLLYKNYPTEITWNAFLCVGLAFPFFLLGLILRKFQKQLDSFDNKMVLIAILIICMYIVHYCGRHNNYVFMFACNYGNNLFLFLTGGIAGITWSFCVSKLLCFKSFVITKISVGSILIMGFHPHFITLGKMLYQESYLLDYAISLSIVILFVPIIMLAERYFPLILGRERIVHS